MTALTELLHFDSQTQALGQVSGRLGWDQETMMPSGSSAQRGEEMAALEGVLHARRSDPRVGDWLAACDGQAFDRVTQAQLREIKTAYERAVKVPGDLAEAIASTTSMAQGKWAAARAEDDFAAFAPVLQEVLALKREEGQALAAGGMSMMPCWPIMSRARQPLSSTRCLGHCAPDWWLCVVRS